MNEYLIYGETLDGIAKQVKRISGVDGKLTPEQMEANLLNVTPLGEYPKAEEAAFGAENVSEEYGITITGSVSSTSQNNPRCYNNFTANEAFSIIGVRIYNIAGQSGMTVRLYDSSGQIVRQVEDVNSETKTWAEVYFDNPVNVAIGESFTVSVKTDSNVTYISKSNVTLNSKVTYNFGNYTISNTLPTTGSTSSLYGIGDIIIGEVAAELPNDYQITRTTMDDIAEEVQRITGTEGKMTTAQITTSLSEIVVHKDSEEVAF